MFNTCTSEATKTMHMWEPDKFMTPIQECDLFTLYMLQLILALIPICFKIHESVFLIIEHLHAFNMSSCQQNPTLKEIMI